MLLPTAMGEHLRAYAWARGLVGMPLIGEALYRLNTLRSIIGLMYRRHVLQRRQVDHSCFRREKTRRGAPAGSTLRVGGPGTDRGCGSGRPSE
jgi:hypothetical protein